MHQTHQRYLRKVDPVLGKLIKEAGVCTMQPQAKVSPYQSLVRSIVYQQLHGKAAETILNRFLDLFPTKRFPKPEEILAIRPERMRRVGLSQAKMLAIRDLARKTRDGLVPTSREILKLSDEEIIERLTSVRGIGIWTVQMMLMFKLARPDVLPATDFGVRKGFSLLYGVKMPTPKELLAFGERWRPYRSIAAWYMWKAVELRT